MSFILYFSHSTHLLVPDITDFVIHFLFFTFYTLTCARYNRFCYSFLISHTRLHALSSVIQAQLAPSLTYFSHALPISHFLMRGNNISLFTLYLSHSTHCLKSVHSENLSLFVRNSFHNLVQLVYLAHSVVHKYLVHSVIFSQFSQLLHKIIVIHIL